MWKIKLSYRLFGLYKGTKYLIYKFSILILRFFSRNLDATSLVTKFSNSLNKKSDAVVENYIVEKYSDVYDKYRFIHGTVGTTPRNITVWTSWFQGLDDAPNIVKESVKSIEKYARYAGFSFVNIDKGNYKNYIQIDQRIIAEMEAGKIKPAHFSDLIRVKLLTKYGGIWFDATQLLIKPIPNWIWEPDLLVWNEMHDLSEKNAFLSIPFTKHFNNGFLVAKEGASFYDFASDITEKLVSDDILKLDYFANFKAYFAGVRMFPWLTSQWSDMIPVNSDGLAARQLWNQAVNENVVNAVNNNDNFFFTMTYKKKWNEEIDGTVTVQEYIRRYSQNEVFSHS